MKLLSLKGNFALFSAVIAIGITGCGKGENDTGTGVVALITSHSDGDIVIDGDLVTFTGNAIGSADTYGDLVTYWYANGEEKCGSGKAEADGYTECEFTIGPDDAEIRLVVNDINGVTGEASVELTVMPVEPPIVTITSPETSGLYYSDIPISFQGTATDANFTPDELTVDWSSDADGVILEAPTSPDSDGLFEGQSSLSEGVHTVTLTGTNPNGYSGTATVDITVGGENALPLCEITAPIDGSAGLDGEEVSFEGTVSDTDIPSEWLASVWESDLDGVLGESTPTEAGEISLPWSGLSRAMHTITLTVTDEVGGECVDSISYTSGTPPTATISAPLTGSIVNDGDATTFEGEALDDDDSSENLIVEWRSDLDGVISTEPASSTGALAFEHTLSTVGDHIVTLTVTDTDGFYAADYTEISLNGLPSAPTVTISPDPAVTTDDLTATATGSVDPEASTVTYSYEWYNGGVISSSSTTDILPSSATSKGESWSVVVTPTDSDGGVGATGTASVVIGNTAPVISTPVITPSTGITTSSTLTCSTTATDTDGETPTISYEWTNGSSTLGTSAGLTLTSSIAAPSDSITCTATATDDSGDTDSGQTNVSVNNTAPVVASVSISPTSGVKVTSTLTCSATSTDADGGSPTITYAWTNGSSTLGTSSSLTLLASTASTGDTITCTATATDADGGTGTATDTATVTNSAPVLASAALTPTSATESSTLTCTPGSATDADADTVSYSYAWNISGVASTQLTSTLSGSYFNRNDTVYCTVTPNDGTANGSAVVSNTVTISNTAPSVSSLSITPTPALDNSTLTCGYSFSDVDSDSDSSTIAWTVSTTTIGTGTTVSTGFVAGDTVKCTVTPNDGTDTGTAVATTALIGASNSAPVITAVTISPSTVYTNDTISASVTATDADGDTISYTYAWYVANALVAETSSAINCTTYCDKGQAVYVVATPSDGTDTGTAVASSSVTLLNSAPTTPTISIDPTTPQAGIDDLICMIDTASTDDDGDTITYTIAWTSDYVVWTGSTHTTYETGDTLSGTDVEPGVRYECGVIATDGSATTSTVKANVTPSATANITHPGGGKMIYISAGTFDMGCTTAQAATGYCSSNESPVHSVTLTHDFYMGETEVTQGEYQAVMGSNPSYNSSCGSTCPVEYVSWHEVAEYANALSLLDGLTECFTCTNGSCTTPNSPYTCDGYRLPTEAEWEYAARAGTDYVYSGSNTVGDVAWYSSNASSKTHPVAQKDPNDWGLYDMSGNVWGWVWDWYDSGYYSSSPSSDPEGPTSGSYRVRRGGRYYDSAQYLRVSRRGSGTPTARYSVGLRLTRTAIP